MSIEIATKYTVYNYNYHNYMQYNIIIYPGIYIYTYVHKP